MIRPATIDPQAFPAYEYFCRQAMEFAEVSGGRFSRYDLDSSKRWLKQRKWREDPPSRRIEYLVELFPIIFDYQKKADNRDCDLERDCAEAQQMIFREAVEKACVSTIYMVEHFNRDWEEQGFDWDQALLEGQSFETVASKLLNYRERWCGCPAISRTLATAMFVTDFGLCLGLPKVSCLKDEMLLKLFQDKASESQLDIDDGGTRSGAKNVRAEEQRHSISRSRSISEGSVSSDSNNRRRFFRKRSKKHSSHPRSARGKSPIMIELSRRNPGGSASLMPSSREKHSTFDLL